jgi:hypothetical protein
MDTTTYKDGYTNEFCLLKSGARSPFLVAIPGFPGTLPVEELVLRR